MKSLKNQVLLNPVEVFALAEDIAAEVDNYLPENAVTALTAWALHNYAHMPFSDIGFILMDEDGVSPPLKGVEDIDLFDAYECWGDWLVKRVVNMMRDHYGLANQTPLHLISSHELCDLLMYICSSNLNFSISLPKPSYWLAYALAMEAGDVDLLTPFQLTIEDHEDSYL